MRELRRGGKRAGGAALLALAVVALAAALGAGPASASEEGAPWQEFDALDSALFDAELAAIDAARDPYDHDPVHVVLEHALRRVRPGGHADRREPVEQLRELLFGQPAEGEVLTVGDPHVECELTLDRRQCTELI